MEAMDPERHEIVRIGVNKSGEWFHITTDMGGLRALDDERYDYLIPGEGRETASARRIDFGDFGRLVDFAFPLLHGPYGEDGTVQGLFEMLDMPYAGCNVTCSAISMDKIFTKELLIRAGLPVCKHAATYAFDFERDRAGQLTKIEAALTYPLFVKPANMGSSVGVSKVCDRGALERGVEHALQYDSRILVEEAVEGRELECAVLGNDAPRVSAVGEIVSEGEFYDYDAKYRNGVAELRIPADISEATERTVVSLATETYKVLGGAGFSRMDFFFEEKTGNIYLNEMNTIPGFTAYSMFPLLWRAKGVAYPELIERIIGFGYERHHAKNNR
jgi:D-alanine-D-alanine ligase